MLSSIHPLGERTRHNRWSVTVTAFALGATVAASLVGALLGLVGRSLLSGVGAETLLLAMALVMLTTGALDALQVPVPGPERQVNEHWIGTFRGWVYGGAFGVQLGAGVATYVVTWGVYATLALELLTASVWLGAIVGAVFGAGRSIGLFLAGRVDRASRLSSFHSRMASMGPAVRVATWSGVTAIGALSLGGVML